MNSHNLDTSKLDESIERGLEFLQRSQLPSGEFKVFISTDLTMQKDCVLDPSLFPAALIAYALSFSDTETARAMIAKSVQFLRAEMAGPGIWRYWTQEHLGHAQAPTDLDDTACVSFVLRENGIAFPANRKLILANRNRQGLFYTWFTPRWPLPSHRPYRRVVLRQWLRPVKLYNFWRLNEPDPYDVDGVVNANVLFYVGESKATQAVIDYLLGIFRRGEEASCDRWYQNRFVFYYAVARNFDAGIAAFEIIRDEAVQRIVAAAKPEGAIGDTVLETALAVCALLSWKSAPPELERAISFLLDAQGATGDWPRSILYYGGPKKDCGFGCEEITTGFCLEALLRYRSLWLNT